MPVQLALTACQLGDLSRSVLRALEHALQHALAEIGPVRAGDPFPHPRAPALAAAVDELGGHLLALEALGWVRQVVDGVAEAR